MNIKNAIQEAVKILPVTWPLQSAIAVNPLWDLHHKKFDEAIDSVKTHLPLKGCLSFSEYLRLYEEGRITHQDLELTFKEHFVEEEKGLSPLTVSNEVKQLLEYIFVAPVKNELLNNAQLFGQKMNDKSTQKSARIIRDCREKMLHFMQEYFVKKEGISIEENDRMPFYHSWKKHAKNFCAVNDNKDLPIDTYKAIEEILVVLKVPNNQIQSFFCHLLLQLVGWHGFIKWMGSHPYHPWIKQKASLDEVILVWCCNLLERQQSEPGFQIDWQALLQENHPLLLKDILKRVDVNIPLPRIGEKLTITKLLILFQRAYELNYQKRLLSKLQLAYEHKVSSSSCQAQFIFCMDTRSEGLRRYLEAEGGYETFGFAGFFGITFTLIDKQLNHCTLQAPALVEPIHDVCLEKKKKSIYTQFKTMTGKIFEDLKYNFFSPYAFFELFGAFFCLPLLGKTLLPESYHHFFTSSSTSTPHPDGSSIHQAFLTADKLAKTVDQLYSFLKTIGLVDNFARTVFVCGHEAVMVNNPYQASYQCGACGGNSGFVNARVVCALLNNAKIRNQLADKGIAIASNTVFVPACHNTTADELNIDEKHIAAILDWERIKFDVEKALGKLKEEKIRDLPTLSLENKSYHWAEMVPEWGLAKNASLIIGPRYLSRGVDLERRVFLHSYEPALDSDGAILEQILTAPTVVAHWINAQYYFSTTDPSIYGSGEKAIHNPLNYIGVMEGKGGDLKIGLPRQAVYFQNNRIHEPLRLHVVVVAPKGRVEHILEKHPEVKSIFDNGWAHLVVLTGE